MYEVQMFATSSADWAQSVELIDATTNLPLGDIDDAVFALAVDDRRGRTVLVASSAAETISRPLPHIVQWAFKPHQMSGLCDGSTYRVGLTMTTANGGTVQLILGSLAFLDGIVAS